MACIAPVRGKTDTKLPWSDVINNDPCGRAAVTNVGGVDVTAQSLCLTHLALKLGLAAIKTPIV